MNANRPFVLKKVICTWPAVNWTPTYLAKLLGDKQLRFRIGSKKHRRGDVLFETDCEYCTATVGQFVHWLQTPRDDSESGPFDMYDPNNYFAYLDYQYMFELFDDNDDALTAVDWNLFGLDRDGFDSTLWMGTRGAHTPCHYDTYGFNLVAQIFGRKRWTFFPPELSSQLKPTRLPYEESSVFADVDLLALDEEFGVQSIHVVELEPGDVLYVPPRWWHFVQCLDDGCISVNTWIDLAEDRDAKLSEATTRCLISLVKENCSDCLIDNACSIDESLACLNQLVDQKREMPTAHQKSTTAFSGDEFRERFLNEVKSSAVVVPQVSLSEYRRIVADDSGLEFFDEQSTDVRKKVKVINERALINALLDPVIVEAIKQVLIKK